MTTSFDNSKQLRFIITLGTSIPPGAPDGTAPTQNTFGSSNLNQVTLEGFRSTVEIDKCGGAQMNQLRAQIYGVSQSDMNTITSLAYQPKEIVRNQIEVHAIDGSQETLIFFGNIITAWGNYNNQPDVFLEIQAVAGLFNQLTPAQPTSYKGTVDVATMMQQLATQMSYTFENNLTAAITLNNPCLKGTLLEQAQDLANMANVDFYLDDSTIAITPRATPRNQDSNLIPEISALSGLVGYPSFTSTGINISVLFNPGIRFGGSISVVSSVTRAAGQWIVSSISHSLSAEKPGGPWFSRISASKQLLVGSS